MIQVRDAVNKEIERLRGENILGSALEAEVVLYVDDELQKVLNLLEDELRFVLITSSAHLESLKNAPKDAVATDLDNLKLISTLKSPRVPCKQALPPFPICLFLEHEHRRLIKVF